MDNPPPIDPAHPDLNTGEATPVSGQLPPAVGPVLVYRGPMTGLWSESAARSYCERLQPTPEPDALERLVADRSGTFEGYGEVKLALSPDPHISWFFAPDVWPCPHAWPRLIPPTAISPEFSTCARGTNPPETPRRPRVAGTNRVPFPAQVGDPKVPIDEIRFYLVNFQVVQLVDDVCRGQGVDEQALLNLRADEWEVSIERHPDLPQALQHLEFERGYAVTHNCRLLRKGDDGERKSFTFVKAEPVLEAVQLFASFVRGGMVGLALPVGYSGGIPILEQWHVTPVDAGRYRDPGSPRPPNWYIWYDGLGLGASARLPSLFDHFAEKWWHPDPLLQDFWRSVFRGLVYTYTDAERTDESRAVVQAGTVLETLGWAVLVVMEGWLTGGGQFGGSSDGYGRLSAGDRLRLLLGWAGLDAEIPSALSELERKAKAQNWDGPEAVTWVRNRIVHPDRRGQLTNDASVEAFRLAMWYAEMVTLRLLGYDGHYRDRLDDGQPKEVPWLAG